MAPRLILLFLITLTALTTSSTNTTSSPPEDETTSSPTIWLTTMPTPSPTAMTYESYGCNIFSNRFTVINGVFQDICGSITFPSSSTSDLSSVDGDLFEPTSVLTLSSSITLNTDKFTVVIEGSRDRPTKGSGGKGGKGRKLLQKTTYEIILGPGDSSDYIYYNGDNDICILSSYQTDQYSECVTLPDDIDDLNTIILYYNNEELNVYQNNEYISTISGSLAMSLGTIAGQNEDDREEDIAIVNIIVSVDVDLDDITTYLEVADIVDPTVYPTVYSVTEESGGKGSDGNDGSDKDRGGSDGGNGAAGGNTEGGDTDNDATVTVVIILVCLFVVGVFFYCYRKRRKRVRYVAAPPSAVKFESIQMSGTTGTTGTSTNMEGGESGRVTGNGAMGATRVPNDSVTGDDALPSYEAWNEGGLSHDQHVD